MDKSFESQRTSARKPTEGLNFKTLEKVTEVEGEDKTLTILNNEQNISSSNNIEDDSLRPKSENF